MRVLHVVTAWPRHERDPITPWLVELVRRQRDAGHDAVVLAPSYRGGPEPGAAGALPVHRFRYAPAALETLTHDETVPDRLRRRPLQGFLLPAYLAAGADAAHRLGRRGLDVVHVHWPMPHALFGAAARHGSGGKAGVVCSFYSVELNWVRHRLPALLPFLRWTVRTADAVTAISRSTAAAVQALAPGPVSVVPYGSAIEDDGAPVARAAGADPDRLRILFVGRLVERKGVEILLRAVARLPAASGAELTVIGAGERERSIRREIESLGLAGRVRMPGFVSRRRLEEEYARADVFVLPAVVDAKGDTEGLGVVLLEALRYERPVVASAVGGIPDIVEPGHTGLLVPPGDPGALAEALQRIAADPAAARDMARRGRVRARERFGWRAVLDRTEEAYRTALERRRGA
ncbi:MAG: glycosyltransferase [Gemmatimonadota bacterium]|nr:glycosyltransferase [Gemmatimonadota bacterium]